MANINANDIGNAKIEIKLTLTFRIEQQPNRTAQYDISRKWIIAKKSSLPVEDLKKHEIFEGKKIIKNFSQNITSREFQSELNNLFPDKIIIDLYILNDNFYSSRFPFKAVVENLMNSNILMVNQSRNQINERTVRNRISEEFQNIYKGMNLTLPNEIEVNISDDGDFIIRDEKNNSFFPPMDEVIILRNCLLNAIYKMLEINFPKIFDGYSSSYSLELFDHLGYFMDIMSDSQMILLVLGKVNQKLHPIISRYIGKEYEIEMDGDRNSRLAEN